MTDAKITELWEQSQNDAEGMRLGYTTQQHYFAALVRAEERASMMQLFTDPENQPTQHGTVTVEYMQREIADERKACAKAGWLAADSGCDDEVFEAIMARGNT